MFVFAIETCGKTVALIQEESRIMLDGFLNGEREEGQYFREQMPESWWDGTSPFNRAAAIATKELPSNGSLPVTISNMTIPSA